MEIGSKKITKMLNYLVTSIATKKGDKFISSGIELLYFTCYSGILLTTIMQSKHVNVA